MGSSVSTPVNPPPASPSEKQSYQPTRRAPTATELLSTLNSNGTKSSAVTAVMTSDQIKNWEIAFQSESKNRLAQTVLHKTDWLNALVKRDTVVNDQHVFNVKLSTENQTVANQKVRKSDSCHSHALNHFLNEVLWTMLVIRND